MNALPHDRLPEQQRNALLRRADWRFLLHQPQVPVAVDMTAEKSVEAVASTIDAAPDTGAGADLVVLGYPTTAGLRAAKEVLRPGGEVLCRWRFPKPAGVRRARSRLRQAGFADVCVHWPGPLPHRLPQFWLPLDSPAAVAYLLRLRPPRSRAQGALRPLWRLAARGGMLAPLFASATLPGEPLTGTDSEGEAEGLPSRSQSWLLLTGGKRSINKVVGLPFAEGRPEPALAVKFARVAEAEPALEREAEVLRTLEQEHPDVTGVPRLRGQGKRAGRLAVAESLIEGRPLLDELSPSTFGEVALRVTRWLVELAGETEPQPPNGWWPRLVDEPLRDLERSFGDSLSPRAASRARQRLEELGALPQVAEHRDCSPWNVVLTHGGAPALLDWESAEPHGLPVLDLTYFLANCVFVLERALESGRTREAYADLLDPATLVGQVAETCFAEYSSRLGLDRPTIDRLRLLCWIVHCRSEYRHAEMDAAGAPSSASLREGVFPGLVEEELRFSRA